MNLSTINPLVIVGLVCLTIAIIGQAKLLFIEINPGFFGRFLALIVAISSLTLAATMNMFPSVTPDLVTNYLTNYASQLMERFTG